MKRLFFTLIILFSLLINSLPVTAQEKKKLKKVKIRGYITNVISPTSFEIDEYKITRDQSVTLNFENQEAAFQFKPEDIRVGTEIQVQGELDPETGNLQAKKVTIDLEQFRKLTNTAVLTKDPEGIEKVENGWQGVFWADGRRIKIEPTTQVLFELNKTEKKEAKEEAKDKKDKKKDDKDKEEFDVFANSEPLKSISEVKAGMFATYEGVEQTDGSVLASRIIFMKNELEKDEDKFWKSLGIQEKPTNFVEGNPGELKIEKIGKFKLLPNKEVQEYVTKLGNSLIPAHQKNLINDNPQKIPFKFYVVNDKDANAFATANGIVVVNSGLITMLENEAQLATVLSHEISHATQEHTWRALNKDKGTKTALVVGSVAASLLGMGGVADILQLTLAAMVNGYSRRLENQADRLGLEYLVAAGYDPREAPRVWKLMAKRYGDMPNTFFWSSHENNATRRSFLMIEIRNNYSQLDLNNLNKGNAEEYQRIISLTTQASAKKK